MGADDARHLTAPDARSDRRPPCRSPRSSRSACSECRQCQRPWATPLAVVIRTGRARRFPCSSARRPASHSIPRGSSIARNPNSSGSTARPTADNSSTKPSTAKQFPTLPGARILDAAAGVLEPMRPHSSAFGTTLGGIAILRDSPVASPRLLPKSRRPRLRAAEYWAAPWSPREFHMRLPKRDAALLVECRSDVKKLRRTPWGPSHARPRASTARAPGG